MEQSLECEVCDGRSFYKSSGFYYCKECQTQSQEVQEQVFERDAATINKKQTKKISKSDSKTEKDALTSWECYNIILKGLTKELIKCGAKRKLKKVVKFLFLRYLHFSQVFEPKEDTAPCISLLTPVRDIELVYGVKKRKRKRNSSDSNSTYSRSSTIRQRTKKKMALVRSQYTELSQSSTQNSNLSDASLSELKSETEKVEESKRITYNVATRKYLRKTMSRNHLKQHATDFHKKLKCHKLTWRKNYHSQNTKIHTITIATLYHILYLGLLIVRDKNQLGDLLRFVREGHISFGAYFHLFPEDCQEKKLYLPRSHQKLSSRQFREKAAQVAHFLRIEKYIEPPNIMELCERYVNELGLPQDILCYVEKFILLSNPEMDFTEKTCYVPNYEARALSFVIFTLKLFFGLDGKSEFKISEHSDKFNNLFNFKNWLIYIKHREAIIRECHFPTVLEKQRFEVDSRLYFKYLKTQNLDYKHDNKFKHLEIRDYYKVLEKIKEVPLNIENGHERQVFFEPSLTPFLSHIERVPEKFSCNLVHRDFTRDSLNFILEPLHYLDKFSFVLNENVIFEKACYMSESKGRRAEEANAKCVTVKISKEESFGKKPSNGNSQNINKMSSWENSYKLTFARNRKKLQIPEDTNKIPFERFWLSIFASPQMFNKYVISNCDAQKVSEKLPFSFRTVLKECCRLADQDIISIYGEYLLTELVLVYREDLYSKNYNKISSGDSNLKLAIKGCLERW